MRIVKDNYTKTEWRSGQHVCEVCASVYEADESDLELKQGMDYWSKPRAYLTCPICGRDELMDIPLAVLDRVRKVKDIKIEE